MALASEDKSELRTMFRTLTAAVVDLAKAVGEGNALLRQIRDAALDSPTVRG